MEGYLFQLTAIEHVRKCLLVKLITCLATVPVSNYLVWVTLFSISTLLCALAHHQPRGAVISIFSSACLFSLLTLILPSDELSRPLHWASIHFTQICPKVSDAKCMTALLNPHFPPNGIWEQKKKKKQTLLGYAHSHSDSSIRPHGSCHFPDWFLAFQGIDWEKETQSNVFANKLPHWLHLK